jgi:flagellar hook-basal body complex protein FliE
MSIDAISALGSVTGLGATSGLGAATGLGSTDAAASTSAASGADFASVLGKGFDTVQSTQANADSLAVQAAEGTLTDPSQLTIAATQASLMTSLATTIESKGVQAFNQIMSMQA